MATPSYAYDYLCKVLMLGDSAVGKTCLALRFCDNTFAFSHLSTIGVDFTMKIIQVDGKKLKMQIWDSAGQERFDAITQAHLKGAMGLILTYDVSERKTFQQIEKWTNKIKDYADDNSCKILVGNKSDLVTRAVTTEEGQALADSLGVKFIETSAKEDINVKDAFHSIASEIKEKIEQRKSEAPERTVRISVKNQEGVKLRCCLSSS